MIMFSQRRYEYIIKVYVEIIGGAAFGKNKKK